MKTKFLDSNELYDGSQLVSLRGYLKHQILGDSVVAWVGPCDVHTDHMVDGEDLLAGARICGASMLHFIIETFDTQLIAAVALQRLFAALVKDVLVERSSNRSLAQSLRREGDDLFAGSKKLSISIATQSPVSSLVHFALNVVNRGTPVETLALEDLGCDAKVLAGEILARFASEFESIREATRKVRWVR